MTSHYNLLDEPWLPVSLADGRVQPMGLLEVMRRSGEISALAETAPPSLVAEYRLLLAIMHRALVRSLGSWKDTQRVAWYRNGLPVDAICDYLEAWRHRFWLFDAEYPFMQVAVLATAAETRDKGKPWTQISLASPTGNNPVLFEHTVDDLPEPIAIPSAIAHLLGCLQFTPSGLVRCFRDGADKAGPLVNTAAVLPLGESLAQTLCLSLHCTPLPGQPLSDLPAWERPALTVAELSGKAMLATGPNDRYSRLVRAVLLEWGGAGQVRWIRFAEGLALEEDGHAPDPFACYRPGSKSLVKVTFGDGRAVWRDLPALAPAPQEGYQAASVVQWAAALHRVMGGRRYQSLLVAGAASEPGKMKMLRWRAERIVLPAAMLVHDERAAELRQHVELAEQVHDELFQLACSLIAATLPDPKSKDTRARARALVEAGPLSATYFAAAERELWALMEMIAQDAPVEAEALWHRALCGAARLAWARVLDTLGMSARALQAEARLGWRLQGLLRKQLPSAFAEATPPTIQTEEA